MAYKVDKMNVSIQKYVSDIIQFKVKNKELGIVTVTGVEVTNELSYCKIYVSFLPNNHIEEKLETLENAKGFIRSELAKKLTTYKCPQLIFKLDDSFDKGQHIEDILNSLKK